jgi:hypothetical protein
MGRTDMRILNFGLERVRTKTHYDVHSKLKGAKDMVNEVVLRNTKGQSIAIDGMFIFNAYCMMRYEFIPLCAQ